MPVRGNAPPVGVLCFLAPVASSPRYCIVIGVFGHATRRDYCGLGYFVWFGSISCMLRYPSPPYYFLDYPYPPTVHIRYLLFLLSLSLSARTRSVHNPLTPSPTLPFYWYSLWCLRVRVHYCYVAVLSLTLLLESASILLLLLIPACRIAPHHPPCLLCFSCLSQCISPYRLLSIS